MRAILLAPLFLAALSACDTETPDPQEQAIQDERDIEMVETANEAPPPMREASPEAITYPDIERHDLKGAACNYAPGTSLGTRVIAREADAFMKIEGEMVRFAADAGARELPKRSRSLYNAKEYSLRLDLAEQAEQADGEGSRFEGTVTLRDAFGRIVYEGTGLAECKD